MNKKYLLNTIDVVWLITIMLIILSILSLLCGCSRSFVYEGHEYTQDKLVSGKWSQVMRHKKNCRFCEQRWKDMENSKDERERDRAERIKKILEQAKHERTYY